MSDLDIARDVRRDIEAAGGSRWLPLRSVRDRFGRTKLTRKARGEIAEALASVHVLAEPSLERAQLSDSVRLYLADAQRVPRPEGAPHPVWAPPPPAPNVWRRFRAWPAWAQWVAAGAALLLVVGALGGGDSGDDGGSPDPPRAQQAGGGGSADDDAAGRERDRARERRRERAKRKRERARERERIRERRERRRERERERRRREREEEEAVPPPAEEEAESSGDCEPGYDPCVPPHPPDVDCPDLPGPVAVTGSDPHGLDADGDGEGCEN